MLIIKHLKYTKSSLPHPRNTITTVIPAKSQIAKAKSPSKILVTCKILGGDFVWPPKRKIRTLVLQQSRRDTGKSECFKESAQKETPRSENKIPEFW